MTTKKFLLETTAGALLSLAASADSVVRKSKVVPITGNLLVKAEGDEVMFTGTNLEVEISSKGSIGSMTGSLNTTVDSKKLVSILQSMPAGECVVLCESANDRLQLQGASGKFTLATMAAADFPRVVRPEKFEHVVTLKQVDLKTLLDSTAFAMASGDVRYYLNGALLSLQSNTLTCVATNGHHLVVNQVELTTSTAEACDVIFPRSAVTDIRKALLGTEDLVTIELTGNQARLAFGGIEYVTKLVEGKFPDYKRVLPAKKHIAKVSRDTWLRASQRARLIASERFQGISTEFSSKNGEGNLLIMSINASNEEANVSITTDYVGPPVEIGFNVSYLVEALASMDAESVEVSVSGGQEPIMITLPENDKFSYVLMPMRI